MMETSNEALGSLDTETLRALVIDALAKHPKGLTVHEAAALQGTTIPAIQPRFSELYAAAVIRDSGVRRPNASGRNAAVWVLA